MNNSITASVVFDFRGQTYRPTGEFDLDQIMHKNGSIPDLYKALADMNGIDTYSYEFDVMESYEMQFSNAQGIAAEYVHDGRFDQDGFITHWYREQQLSALREIAKQEMGIDDLDQHLKLKAALFSAYQKGQENAPRRTY